MKGFCAFINKELLEQVRSRRLLIFGAAFAVLGIMNPMIAKLTPVLFEAYSDQLAGQGIVIGEITVTAMDAWSQFIKNAPIAVMITVVIFGGIFTGEYSKGTLIPLVTKGLSRNSAVLAKLAVMCVMWSVGIWCCFGITYLYSAIYWDNSIVKNLAFSGIGWWIFGLFMISVLTFVSAFANSMVQVLLGTGGIYLVIFIMSRFAKISKSVEKCHNKGICHRDLKLENIMLDKNNEPVLCEFGTSCIN